MSRRSLHVADAGTGRLVSRGPEVLAALADVALDPADGSAVAEPTLSRLETVTSVARDVEDVVARAARLRTAAARAAEGLGLRLLASGTPPLGSAEEQQVAPDERYLPLRARAAGLVDQQAIAGLHVHVAVAAPGTRVEDVDDEARVAVVERIRPWLPVLLAATANSPYWLGTDTGFASYRQVHWQRWPVAGPPPPTGSAAAWHEAVASLVDAGVVDDASLRLLGPAPGHPLPHRRGAGRRRAPLARRPRDVRRARPRPRGVRRGRRSRGGRYPCRARAGDAAARAACGRVAGGPPRPRGPPGRPAHRPARRAGRRAARPARPGATWPGGLR
nr:glutamate-cysteine ligase family protein [Angustibacter aerolatus]